MLWLGLFLLGLSEERALPSLETIFEQQQSRKFAELLPKGTEIACDLRPMVPDHGMISGQQARLAFTKLFQRYEFLDVEITNSQSDTNYAWLEIYLNIKVRDKRNDAKHRVTMAIYFKISASRMAISRWVIQDFH
jgi:hypothetical protein